MAGNGGRKAKRYGYLNPRTSTKPISLAEYVEGSYRDRVVNDDRLTPEYKAWYDKRVTRFGMK
jgi:hypothetical protein